MRTKPLIPSFTQGQIWTVLDSLLAMPSGRSRTFHEFRGVVILTSDTLLQQGSNLENVLVAPLSTNLDWIDPLHDVILPPKSNGAKEQSRLVLSLVQPMQKQDLHELKGQLGPFELMAIKNKLAEIFGARR